jgi:DHA1 family bicyclomycin/chloramphenicol resistance-like MFS transporter
VRRIALLITVGFLTALGPLGTDTYLPALPEVIAELDSTDSLGQITLSVYLFGLGIGQFIWGPVSDRIGRRAPLLIGIAAFTVAALGCAVAPNMGVLIAARLLMGMAGSAGVVVSRAIVRDLYEGRRLTQIFSRLTIVFGIAPIVGPLVGSGILQFSDWRGTFIGLVILGAVLLAAAAICIPETLTDDRRLAAGRAAQREAWAAVFRNGQFRLYVALLVLVCAGMYTYVTFSSIVLQGEWGVLDWQFGLIFGINAIAVIVGGQLTAWLVKRIRADRILGIALAANIVFTALVLVAAVAHWPVWALDVALWLVVFQVSVCQPLTIALALAPFERGAGTAAAVQGGLQFAVASLIPLGIAAIWGTSGVVLGVSLLVIAVAALGVAIGGMALRRRAAIG